MGPMGPMGRMGPISPIRPILLSLFPGYQSFIKWLLRHKHWRVGN